MTDQARCYNCNQPETENFPLVYSRHAGRANPCLEPALERLAEAKGEYEIEKFKNDKLERLLAESEAREKKLREMLENMVCSTVLNKHAGIKCAEFYASSQGQQNYRCPVCAMREALATDSGGTK